LFFNLLKYAEKGRFVSKEHCANFLKCMFSEFRPKNLQGHRASDWPKDPNWTGKLKIVAKGRTAAIILSDERNQVFAICQVTDDSSVQKVLDSGRYFVLRITNQQGRHAYIGIAFNERNDAFDFNVALSEFRSELDREENAAKFFSEHTNPVDLTLKEGEKIKIKLNSKKSDSNADSGGKPRNRGGTLLPPPDMRSSAPQSVSVVRSISSNPTTVSQDSLSAHSSDPFGWSDSLSSSSSDTFSGWSSSSSDPLGFPSPSTSDGSTQQKGSLLDF
jgi:hypothetical protein